MTTRGEFEAAAKRRLVHLGGSRQQYHGGFIQREADGYTLANAYLAERSERQRRIEAAAEKVLGLCLEIYDGDMLAGVRDIITRCLDGEAT